MKKSLTALILVAALCLVPTMAMAAELVGYVDMGKILNSHPRFASTQKQLANFANQKEKEVDTEVAKAKDNAAKEQIVRKKAREVADKEAALMEPIFKDIDAATRASAKANGVSVVVNVDYVVCGGKDLTNDVLSRLK